MTSRSLARKYAHALYDIVSSRRQVDAAKRDLAGFSDLVGSHEELRRALTTPVVPTVKKKAVVAALVEKAGMTSVEVRRLLDLLTDQERLGLLADVAAAFVDRCREAEQVVQAEVTSAVPLNDAQRTAVSEALGHALGQTVAVTERVDPSLVGGVVARVGSVVFDGSVARQVERLRQKLLADARG